MLTFLLLIMTSAPVLAAEGSGTLPALSAGSFGNLSSAKYSLSTAGKTLVIDRSMSCNGLTIPADRPLEIKKGGMIRFSGHLQLDGPIAAGSYQIFEPVGGGYVTFGPGASSEISSSWFGAKGDGVTDSTKALTAAIAAANGSGINLRIASGTYLISAQLPPIKPNYTIVAEKSVVIKANAPMAAMAQIGGGPVGRSALSYYQGSMTGITWDANHLAQAALSTGDGNWLNGYAFYGVKFINAVKDGMITGDNYWSVGFFNCAFNNNGSSGYHQRAGANAGENISFFNCSFFNNTGSGMLLENAGAGGATVSCHGCAFDYNAGWAIQNGTSSPNFTVLSLLGGHIEQESRYLRNFGIATLNGVTMMGGSKSGAAPGHLIEVNGVTSITGGWIQNGGTGKIFSKVQLVLAQQVLNIPSSFPGTEHPGNPIASGRVYQNAYPVYINIAIPVTYGIGPGNVTAYIGSTDHPVTVVNRQTGNSNSTPTYLTVRVPPGWYYKVEASTSPPAYLNAGHVISYN